MIDIGVNLTHSQLLPKAEEVLNRAKAAGIIHCVITGTDLESSQRAIGLIDEFDSRFPDMLSCTAGVHPHDAKDWSNDSVNRLSELLKHPRVVAVGETGLDFNRNYSPQAKQVSAFEAQIEMAIACNKPLFLHERDAFDKQFEILKYYRDALSSAVIHCFTGDRKSLFSYLDLDLHIGVTGWICDERRGQELAEIVRNIPLARLMIETDAPFLLPRNMAPKPKSRTNEPENLPWIIRKIAASYDKQAQEIAIATAETATHFFGLNTGHD